MKSLLQYLLEMEESRTQNKIFENDIEVPDVSAKDTNDKEDESIDINGLIVIKPGFLDKEIEIRAHFEEEGWKIVGETTKKFTEEEARDFYKDKESEPYYDDLVEYMSSDDSKCLMLWKEEAAKPIEEIQSIKEKLRAELSEDEMKNVLHSSDSFDNMEKELNIIMSEPEEDDETEDDSDSKDEDDTEDSDNEEDNDTDEEEDSDSEDDNELSADDLL